MRETRTEKLTTAENFFNVKERNAQARAHSRFRSQTSLSVEFRV